MIGIQENKITKIPLLEAVARTQAVAAAIEAKDFAKAISYRDSEFRDMLTAFEVSSSLTKDYRVPESQSLNIGIIQCVQCSEAHMWICTNNPVLARQLVV